MYKVRIHVGVETRISQPMAMADALRLADRLEKAFPGMVFATAIRDLSDLPTTLSPSRLRCGGCSATGRKLARAAATEPLLCGQCLNKQEAI